MLLSLLFLIACEAQIADDTDTGGGGEDDTDDSDDTDDTDDSDTDSQGVDLDNDGVTDDEDCDDSNADVFPGADELCNSVDDDCDEEVDEDATDAATFFADFDADSFGDADATVSACAAPSGYVTDSSDCDDTNTDVFPGADELCNTVDDDCDGSADEDATDPSIFFADADSDTYGDADTATSACTAPSGYVTDSSDCDDTNADVSPAASETCNSADDDCSGDIDDDPADGTLYYADVDGDTFGDPDVSVVACDAPSDHVVNNTDCDDADGEVNPNGIEICNDTDDDCNDLLDDDATDTQFFFADLDDDGHGDSNNPITACERGPFMSGTGGDCDDTNKDINPTAQEECDGADTNCDGSVDNALDAPVYFADADGDGFFGGDGIQACTQPSNTSDESTDCNDDDADVNPDALEVPCDGQEQDCVPGDFPLIDNQTGVFYAEGASGSGTKSSPLGDLQAAIDAAEGANKPWVYLHSTDGIIDTNITTSTSLLGALEADFSDTHDTWCETDTNPPPFSDVLQATASTEPTITAVAPSSGHIVVAGLNVLGEDSYDQGDLSRLSLVYGKVSGTNGTSFSDLDLYVRGTGFEGLGVVPLTLTNVTATMNRPLIGCYSNVLGVPLLAAENSNLDIVRLRADNYQREGCDGIVQTGGQGDLILIDSEVNARSAIAWSNGTVVLRNNRFYSHHRSTSTPTEMVGFDLHGTATATSIGNTWLLDPDTNTAVAGIRVGPDASLLMGHDVVNVAEGDAGAVMEVHGEATVVNSAVLATDSNSAPRTLIRAVPDSVLTVVNSYLSDVNASARMQMVGLETATGAQVTLDTVIIQNMDKAVVADRITLYDSNTINEGGWPGAISVKNVRAQEGFSLDINTMVPYDESFVKNAGTDPSAHLGDDATLSWCGYSWSDPCGLDDVRPLGSAYDIGPIELSE